MCVSHTAATPTRCVYRTSRAVPQGKQAHLHVSQTHRLVSLLTHGTCSMQLCRRCLRERPCVAVSRMCVVACALTE